MIDEATRTALREVFGDDSDGEDIEHAINLAIQGLKHVKAWLSPSQQEELLTAIECEEWFDGEANQAMRFGGFPDWADELSERIRSQVEDKEISQRQPLFNQLIANKYEPGEGLKPHVDLMQFQDCVAIVSLQSRAIMKFTRADQSTGVLLEPGDLLLLQGPARYDWMHGIAAVPSEEWQGRRLVRGQRLSITLRKLVWAEAAVACDTGVVRQSIWVVPETCA